MNEDLQDNDLQERSIQKLEVHTESRKNIEINIMVVGSILCLWLLKYSIPMFIVGVITVSVGHNLFLLMASGSMLATMGAILFIVGSFKKRLRVEFVVAILIGLFAIGGTLYSLSDEELMSAYTDTMDKYTPGAQRIEFDKNNDIVKNSDTTAEDIYDVEMNVVDN